MRDKYVVDEEVNEEWWTFKGQSKGYIIKI